MLRLLAVGLVALCCVPCFAQGKKQEQPKQRPINSRQVGDRFTLTAPIFVSTDERTSLEFEKSYAAGDNEGMAELVKGGKITRLPAGVQLVVLEISTVDRRREDKSSICRAVKDGESLGKYIVHWTQFSDKTMRRDKSQAPD